MRSHPMWSWAPRKTNALNPADLQTQKNGDAGGGASPFLCAAPTREEEGHRRMTGQPREEVKLFRGAQHMRLREEEDAVPIWSAAAPKGGGRCHR